MTTDDVIASTQAKLKKFSFMGSMADNVRPRKCHNEALQYRDGYKTLREQLTRRLFTEFNKNVFGNALDADMAIVWNGKFRTTAGRTNSRGKNAEGVIIRSSIIHLSTKVLDTPQRLRDTLIHELCHAACWVIDGQLLARHGPMWKKWVAKSLKVYPELGEIRECHNMEIHFKYSYKCTQCGYNVQRHSKSIDITIRNCDRCHGKFEVFLNRKNKNGVVVTKPSRKAATNVYAAYIKQNYARLKEGGKTHAQVIKLLKEEYAAKKCKPDQ